MKMPRWMFGWCSLSCIGLRMNVLKVVKELWVKKKISENRLRRYNYV